jgi:hypothetical protein
VAITERGHFGANNFVTATTSVNLTVPSGIAAGDVGYIVVSIANTSRTLNALTGWTVVDGPISATGLRGWLLRRTMDGTESGTTVTPTLNNTSIITAGIVVFAGANASDEVVSTATFDSTEDAVSATSAVTPSVADAMLITLFAVRNTSVTGTTGGTAPTGYTEVWDYDNAGTNGTNGRHGVYVATKQLTGQSGVSQTSVAGAWIPTSAREVNWTIALGPAAVPAQGAATGTLGWSGSATGSRPAGGSTTGSMARVGSATGKRIAGGAATGATLRTGAATGVRASSGAATGATSRAGSATGQRIAGGSASGTTLHAGSAAGARSSSAAASGSVVWVGSASGSAPGVGASEGSATGTIALAGSATGARTSAGSTSGAVTWVGFATGTAPEVGVTAGSASGSITWAGAATGEAPGEAAPGPDVSAGEPLPPSNTAGPAAEVTHTATLAPIRYATSGPVPLRHAAGRPT